MGMDIIPQGILFLNKIGEFIFRDNVSGDVMFVGEYNSTNAINITTTAQDIRAGSGNALLMRTYSDRTVEINMVARDWNLGYIAASVGRKLSYDLENVFVISKQTDIDEDGIGTLEKVPTGNVYVKLESGADFNVAPVAPVPPSTQYTIDLSPFNITDTCVKVTYQYATDAKSVVVTADGDPLVANLILTGKITSSRSGEVGEIQVDIPSFALDGNISISMNADGSATETTLNGVALAVDGSRCGDGSVYGYVREIKYDDIAPQLIEIIAAPSPMLLDSSIPESAQITVLGNRGIMHTEVGILSSECSYVSSNPAIAIVDSNGLVTAVAAGDCEITVAHIATSLEDIVEVIAT